MNQDPYETAVDQVLKGADGDVRLALRTLLIQILELQAKLQSLSARVEADTDPVQSGNATLN